ncbi:hypothetical protein [Egicoccus sp. AB-alg2]|uniref:hypothetical protein n=1 Tax=Egicoccus sp. AB-alg2 TaxID=3242693 RepID=UPI00359CD793
MLQATTVVVLVVGALGAAAVGVVALVLRHRSGGEPPLVWHDDVGPDDLAG